MTPPPSLLVSTRTLSSPYVDGCREIRMESRPLLLQPPSAVRGRSREDVLAGMTQELDKAPTLFLLSARDNASEDASLDLLLPLPVGGVGLTVAVARPATDAPPGRAGKLSPRCLGGVFLNRDSLPLPEPLPSTPRPLLIWVSLAGEREAPLLLPSAPALARLPRVRPRFLELESALLLPLLLLPFLLLLRASDELDVPIREWWRLAGPDGDSSTLISSVVRLCHSSVSLISSSHHRRRGVFNRKKTSLGSFPPWGVLDGFARARIEFFHLGSGRGRRPRFPSCE